MKLNFTVDLHGVINELDLTLRIRKALGILRSYHENVDPTKWDGKGNVWDAFFDDIRSLDTQSKTIRDIIEIKKEKIDDIIIYLENYSDVANNISKEISAKLSKLLLMATNRTDSQAPYELWIKIKSF